MPKLDSHEASQRRRRILDALIETFKRKGFEGASLNDLAAATGLAKASLYHRYPGGKEELGRVALAESGRRFAQLVLRPLQSADPAADRLAEMMEGILVFYGRGHAACLMNSLTLGDGAALYGPTIRATMDSWAGLIAAAFAELGEDRSAARAHAEDVIARIQGTLILARLSGDPGGLKDTLRRSLADLARRVG